MKIESGLHPNCSEAVFRFYTEDPKVAHRILQSFADEVAEANEHPAEIVPEFQEMEKIKQVSFGACAGMGEPVTKCIWELKRKAFVLCIGNNDISPDGTCARELLDFCMQKRRFCDVDSRGNVMPCSFVRTPMGNLLEKPLAEIWRSRGEQAPCPFVGGKDDAGKEGVVGQHGLQSGEGHEEHV